MQNQKQAGLGDHFGTSTQDEIKIKAPELAIPDVHESMRLAGAKDLVLSPTQRNSRLICCCGSPGCGTGPMTRVEEAR